MTTPRVEQPSPPRGILAWLLRFPVLLYRARLGFLLGHRFLVLVHEGRRTHRHRSTPLEVVRYEPATREAVVVAGWGRKTGWLHNVEAGLAREVWIGRERWVPAWRRLEPDEGAAVIEHYERHSGIPVVVVRAVLSRLLGWSYDGSPEARRRLVEQLALIGFRPATAAVPGAAPAEGGTWSGVKRVPRSHAAARATYDRLSRWYDGLVAPFERRAHGAALRAAGVRPGETVLEIGFGTGHDLVRLARAVGPTGRVLGLDISPAMRRVAEERLRRAGLADRVELTTGDAITLPYPDGSVDVVILTFVLELFDTPEIPSVLAGARRVLRPGGRLVVTALARDVRGRPTRLLVRLYEALHDLAPSVVDCRPIPVAAALREAGFEVRTVARSSLWGLPVETVVGTAG